MILTTKRSATMEVEELPFAKDGKVKKESRIFLLIWVHVLHLSTLLIVIQTITATMSPVIAAGLRAKNRLTIEG